VSVAAGAGVAWVAGATGFVGRAVVPALVAHGARTIAHVRPDSSALDDWRKRFAADGAEVDTAAWDAAVIGARLAAAGVTHVFCLIGTTRKKARSEQIEGDIYQAIDVGLTRTLIEACKAGGVAPRFVYLSSVGASESASSAYLKARGQAERLVIDSGLPYRIARPSIISGPGRDEGRPGERVAGVIGDGLLAVAGVLGGRRLRDRYRSTTPDILAAALVRLGFDAGGDRIVDGAGLR
jgi:nucleoside-diphosphate-sugar epimerase